MTLPRCLTLLAASCSLLLADESAFDSAPDASWTRFDPIERGTFDFSGGTCRLSCGRYSYAELEQLVLQYGYGVIPAVAPRVVLFAPSQYADTCVSVDLVDWVPTTDRAVDGQFHALFTRIQPVIGPGMTSGYGMSVIDLGNGNAELEINLLVSEAAIPLGDVVFPFNQESTYRLVLSSRGDTHTARVFDLASPATPVAEVKAFDGTYTTGRNGFGVLTDRYTHPAYFVAPDATFDNFLAWDATPCPVMIEPGNAPDTIVLTSDLRRSMGSDLQTTTDPAVEWLPAFPNSVETAGGQLRLIFNKDGPRRFFRRKNL
jgi:hypothetical protein